MDPVPGDDDASPPRSPGPSAGNDPADPLRPEVDEEERTPPLAAPQLDMDATEDADQKSAADDDDDDDQSELSDLDDQQFEDFDVNAITIDERPLDEEAVGQLKSHKRKRTEGEEAERKKKREKRRRDKPRKSRRNDESGDVGADEGTDAPRRRNGAERPRNRVHTPDAEEDLSPEERRRRALDRAMDNAVKGPNKRRKRLEGIDLEQYNDDLLDAMRRRMTEAAKADALAREQNRPATQKLKLLPEVTALLNRNNLRDQLVDPDLNLLEAVRFFLEPLSDGSLPSYNIQRALFMALAKLPIGKDTLVASGIGKVTLFYTKSPKAEPNIKRQAERLLGEWTRPIIKRSDDYRKREFVQANYNPNALPVRSSQAASQDAAAVARERKLAAPTFQNRARVEGGLETYTVVPRSTVVQTQGIRVPGSGGDQFRKMKMRHQAKMGGGGSRR